MTKIFYALFIAVAIMFVSCDEIETSDLTLDQSKSATVQAYIYASLDLTAQGLEFAPNGTNVIVSIPNSAFNSSASGQWVDTAIVANGMISLTVPTTDNGVTVSFTPAEFTYDQVQAYGSNSATILKLYKSTSAGSLSSVKPSEFRTHEITYNSISTFDNFTETVDVKFEGIADVDQTVTDEFVPASTVITIYNSNFSTTVSAGAAGRFDVSIPKSESVTLVFEATKTLNTVPVTTKKYKYTTTYGAPSTSTPVVQTINFGSGQVWE